MFVVIVVTRQQATRHNSIKVALVSLVFAFHLAAISGKRDLQ